ncbi:hypothetical protein ACFSTI_01620 [Rhizorhabdus histidinilytica]
MRPYSFLADPFGLWRDDRFHLFVERFDYRDRRGVIELIVHDAGLTPLYRCKILSERWHLSYPFVFEAEGQIWMLPEAHRSGGLTLYRCFDFPDRWQRAARIELDCVPVDATPFWHDGLWWLFYAAADDRHSKVAHLHVAFSERLTDGWRPHPANPVRRDPASARPGERRSSSMGGSCCRCRIARAPMAAASPCWRSSGSPPTTSSRMSSGASPRPPGFTRSTRACTPCPPPAR